MKSLHITMTEFRNESRIIKESRSLIKSRMFKKVRVLAMGAEDLPGQAKVDENFDVVRIHLKTRKLPRKTIFQALKYLEFCIRILLEVRRFAPEVVSVHAVTLLPLGWLSKIINGHKLIYDTHELETEVDGLTGARKKILKYIEAFFIRHCSLVIVVGENIADWYAKEYNIPRPIVVRNAPFVRELKRNDYFREKLGIGADQVILLYQGGLMLGRGVNVILDAFKARNDSRIVAVFMGYGELESEVVATAKLNRNIFFFPAVSPQSVLEYTASADVGVSLIENTCLSYYFCLPNKLFEYAMAGLPVLVSNMKEMAETVEREGMGIVVSDYSVEGLNQAIDRLLDMDLEPLKNRTYQAAVKNSWETQEQVMLAAYRKWVF